MGTVEFDILEEKFQKKYTQYYELSLLVGADSFSYSIADKHQGFLGYRRKNLSGHLFDNPVEWREALRTAWADEAMLRRPFARVRIGYEEPRLALVPNRLFQPADGRAYLQAIHPLAETDIDLCSEVPAADAMGVFALPRPLHDIVQQYFPQAPQVHAGGALIQALAHWMEGKLGVQVFAHVRNRSVQIVVFDRTELLFYNVFPYQTASDLAYFVLLIYHQLNLKPDSVPLRLSGFLVEDSECYRALYRYVRQVHWLNFLNAYFFGPKFSASVSPHWVADLLAMKG